MGHGIRIPSSGSRLELSTSFLAPVVFCIYLPEPQANASAAVSAFDNVLVGMLHPMKKGFPSTFMSGSKAAPLPCGTVLRAGHALSPCTVGAWQCPCIIGESRPRHTPGRSIQLARGRGLTSKPCMLPCL